jgi:hypothetical protein
MHEHKLYLWPEKCKFKKTRIEYLDIIISHNKVEKDPVKVTGAADWPTPTNKKEVQSFVRFINFYCQFIPGFSHHAHTLFDLTMKDVRFMLWGITGWCVMVMCRSWWHTDICASTVGVHCSTPTPVKHSNQYTYMRKFTYLGMSTASVNEINVVSCLVEWYVNASQSRAWLCKV